MRRRQQQRESIHPETIRPESPPREQRPLKTSTLGDTIGLWIYRYNLSTALYMLEPWERALFNVIVLAVMAYIAYGLYYSALHPLFERFAASYM